MALTPRPYQLECLDTFERRIDHVDRGGLVVLPTGTGKSCVMGEMAEKWLNTRRGGVGIISHRRELVNQNANEYDAYIGKPGACYRERGSEHRLTRNDWDRIRNGGVVSFTVQTMQGRRMARAGADAIGLLLVDECHRIRDKGQYNKVRDYFGCKWVGLTATPDRTDGAGLVPAMFDECWYGHKEGQLINDFVEQGWLTPPRVQHVHVGSLQWQWLKGRSGKDFTNEQVSKVWADYKAIHEFVGPIMKEVQSKKTLYFCPGVGEAKGVADVINSVAHPHRIAEYVASYRIDEEGARSDYPPQTRRIIIKRFGDQKDVLQHVSNMGVFVEGTNVPIISAIGWLRFTKSRLLLAQGAGRAFRTWPGVLDGMENASAAERRAAIAASPKPFALIFDPTRRAGTKLRLAHLLDVFNPSHDKDDLQRRIDQILKSKSKSEDAYDPREVLEEAKTLESPFFKGLRAALLEIAPTIDYKLVEIDPYKGNSTSDWAKPKKEPKARTIGDATPGQKKLIGCLTSTKYSDDFMMSLSKKQAGAIVDKLNRDPCQPWIVSKLKNAGIAKLPLSNGEGMAALRSLRK